MKTSIVVSLLIAVASAVDIAAREPQPAALYAGVSDEVKAVLLTRREGSSGLKLARQYNCDGACILANSGYCDSEACEEGIDANCLICCLIHDDNCPDCALGGQYC